MEQVSEFVLTSAVARLRSFLDRPGARHALLIGPPGSGKTSALFYLAAHLRQENHLVILVQLTHVEDGDRLAVLIARSLLQAMNSTAAGQGSEVDALAQFGAQIIPLQRLSDAPGVLNRLFQLAAERLGSNRRVFLFLDGFDEVRETGPIALAMETLADNLTSASLVISSRSFPAADRLQHSASFDTFTLDGFTPLESADLVRRLFPERALPQSIVDEMISRANGSPFVLRLLGSVFQETGQLSDQDNSIGRLLDRALARLGGADEAIGADARLLLKLLVILQPVSMLYLAKVSGFSEERARTAFQVLSGSALVSSSQTMLASAHPILAKYIVRQEIDVSALQFGDEAAERDSLFRANFMPPRDLQSITSGTKTIVLGDRGSGKSAVFRALHEVNEPGMLVKDFAPRGTVITVSQNPGAFVQQMTADDSTTSSAEGFKAIWLLYSAALAARDIHPLANSDDQNGLAFVKDARKILRRIGWGDSIKGENRASRWMAALRSVLPEKVTLKLGPVTVEPNWTGRGQGWFRGNDIRIDDFIDRADRFLQSIDRRLLIVFDQIDEAFKYQRDKQEALVQGLFLAESFLSLRRTIRLVVLLRTDLFEIYDIQEKNKFVSRTVRLDWSREDLKRQLLQRLFSNPDLDRMIDSLECPSLQGATLAQIQLRMVFPAEVEGKPFEEWLFEGLRNGKNHVAPRQIILFLNLAREIAKDNPTRRQIPLLTEKDLADAMTRLSELSYQEVISDFRVATSFVRNCRAGKIIDIELEKVQTLFDKDEGAVALQLERLERLGFVERLVVREGDSLLPRFRIPLLFTRCWQTSD
jgi:energy-coupling factor transporter ATP-binding protein EcfA2